MARPVAKSAGLNAVAAVDILDALAPCVAIACARFTQLPDVSLSCGFLPSARHLRSQPPEPEP